MLSFMLSFSVRVYNKQFRSWQWKWGLSKWFKKGLYSKCALHFDNKEVKIKWLTLLIFFIKEMDKGVIKLTCAGMMNILKYIPGFQGVDDAVRPCSLALIPGELKTQKLCKKSVEDDPGSLAYVLDHFKTHEMCSSAVRKKPYTLRYVHDHLKIQEMCDEAVRTEPLSLPYVPDRLKTQEMCSESV